MSPKDVMRGIPRQSPALSFDREHTEVENVETLIEHVKHNKDGDLELAPDDVVDFSPAEIARRIQNGEDW